MPTTEQLLYALLPPVLMLLAGTIASYRPPPASWRSGILHLAAGVVFAVVAVEIVPDLMREHRPIETAAGFAVGVIAMLVIRWLTEAKRESDSGGASSLSSSEPLRLPFGLLAGIAVDLAVDGLMIGVGFAAGVKEGRLLAVALAVELIALGLAVAATLSKAGVARRRSVALLAGLMAAFLASAIVGLIILTRVSGHALAAVLSFGAGALLFLVTEELLTEAHEEEESPVMTALFFAGFLAFLLLGMLA